MANYAAWKKSVMGDILNIDGSDPGQCTQVALSWGMYQFPGIHWNILFPPVPVAKDMFTHVNKSYFQVITNDHNNPNQLPQQGDIMVFDHTPQPGYSNTYNNPAGHIGVCDKATPAGYILIQENAPAAGEPVNATAYTWRFRPCLGWLRAKSPHTVTLTTVPATNQTITITAPTSTTSTSSAPVADVIPLSSPPSTGAAVIVNDPLPPIQATQPEEPPVKPTIASEAIPQPQLLSITSLPKPITKQSSGFWQALLNLIKKLIIGG